MCYQSSNCFFIKGIVISLWTILKLDLADSIGVEVIGFLVQTSFHIIFVLGGYYACQFKPSHFLLVIFYLTYFYDYDKCGSISLGGESIFSLKLDKNSTRLIDLETEATDEEDNIYKIIHTIVEKAILPRESKHYFRTQLYLFCYVINDGCWLFSAFLLFAGICFQVKKFLSLIFYGPWLIITGVTVLLDVVAAVHFGLDLLQIYSYTSWLRFIGVSNYEEFAKFNKYKSSVYMPHISSITMILFWSRFCAFWILNIVNFFTIFNSFAIAYRGDSRNGRKSKKPVRRSNGRVVTNQTMNSSESRIRNWQMFYGTVETNSTRSSVSSKSVVERDYNSNSRVRNGIRKNSEEQVRKVAGNSTTRYSLDSNIEFSSAENSSPKLNSNYLKFQDVTEGVNTNQIYGRGSDDDDYQINQRPWSYLRFNERPPSILLEHGENSNGRNRQVNLAEIRTGSTAL